MDVVNSGSINEFTISMGGNINNILYFGASIGIQSVHKKLGVTYQEEYGYFNTDGIGHDGSGNALAEQFDVMNLYQEMEMNGSGVNFKLGFTARPLTGLRVGVAFHTPTYYSLDYSYRADIFSDIRNNADNKVATVGNATPRANNSGGNSWDFTSPARLMFGASYTFGTFAIVSIDYERDWYNGIRVKNVPQYNYFSEEDYKAEFKHNFQGTNSIRAGVEVKPLPILALRVGGGYTDSMLKERDFYVNDAYTSMPTTMRATISRPARREPRTQHDAGAGLSDMSPTSRRSTSSSSAGPKTRRHGDVERSVRHLSGNVTIWPRRSASVSDAAVSSI